MLDGDRAAALGLPEIEEVASRMIEDPDELEPTAEDEPACIEPSDEVDAAIDDALYGDEGEDDG